MENTLKRLFDFQRFDRNEDLQRVIDSVHAKYAARELSMDEMSGVNAAGNPELDLLKKKDREHDRK